MIATEGSHLGGGGRRREGERAGGKVGGGGRRRNEMSKTGTAVCPVRVKYFAAPDGKEGGLAYLGPIDYQ